MRGGDYRDLMSSDAEGDEPGGAMLLRRKRVVVIGIDDYLQLPRLRHAVSDVRGVQDVLVQQFGFDAPIEPLTNGAATKPAIEALVEDDLPKILAPEDALVLFFAGHGTTRVSGLHDVEVETGYLAPVEARGRDRFSDLINMEELLRTIGLLPARHVLVVLDACHSGMALGSSVTRYRSWEPYAHRLTQKRSRRVITSARCDELALDSGPIPGHSLFTGMLIEALTSGRADMDGNGIITFSELALFLYQQVGQASGSRQTPDYGAFHLDDRGEMVIAVNQTNAAAPTPEPRPKPPGHEPTKKPGPGPIRVFFSYSHKDEKLRDELELHLKLLQRQKVIDAWHDRQIGAGEERKGAIDQHLEEAQVILLLVSSSYLASDYCYDVEMTRALERHSRGEARVIPIILRPCDWRGAPFAKLQALPRKAESITSQSNRDEAWTDVAREIRSVVEKLRSPSPSHA